jgi:hypothetical protein
MSDKCIEIGTIQAFLDGETSPDLSFKISGHVADCDKCAFVLAEAEEESSVVFSALDREFNSMVPTQRLWSSINEAIAYEKSHKSFWDRVRGSLSALFANPSITVAASVLLVFGIFAAVWSLKPVDVAPSDIATVQPKSAQTKTVDITGSSQVVPPPSASYTVGATKFPADKVAKLVRTANFKPASDQIRAQPAVLKMNSAEEYLPGEESYVRTIADLRQNVDGKKDRIMNPSSRIAYERDMAVVNDAITKMKEVVKKNPKNQSAKQVLYSSYQNKIDLLNSVVEREELMASLKY